eukprot:5532318-Amphidinium_carterae.1
MSTAPHLKGPIPAACVSSCAVGRAPASLVACGFWASSTRHCGSSMLEPGLLTISFRMLTLLLLCSALAKCERRETWQWRGTWVRHPKSARNNQVKVKVGTK